MLYQLMSEADIGNHPREIKKEPWHGFPGVVCGSLAASQKRIRRGARGGNFWFLRVRLSDQKGREAGAAGCARRNALRVDWGVR